jgi:hypothetical protein
MLLRVSYVTESLSDSRRQNSPQECIFKIAHKPHSQKFGSCATQRMLSDELSATKNAHIARRK